jgi:hypothetical protein
VSKQRIVATTSTKRFGLFNECGVEFTREVEDCGYGLVTYFEAPGLGGAAQLYEPKYAK